VWGCGFDSSGSGLGPVSGCCVHGNESSNCIKVVSCLSVLTVSLSRGLCYMVLLNYLEYLQFYYFQFV
jgi:hypothetical protein